MDSFKSTPLIYKSALGRRNKYKEWKYNVIIHHYSLTGCSFGPVWWCMCEKYESISAISICNAVISADQPSWVINKALKKDVESWRKLEMIGLPNLWRCTHIKQMNTQSAGVEPRVYEACDSPMVVMEELKAPGGRRRGCCEQILCQRWMEFTGQPSTLLYSTLRRGTERFWFQMMEGLGALSINGTTGLQTSGWQQRDVVLFQGTCPRTPKWGRKNQALTLNLNRVTDILFLQKWVFLAGVVLLQGEEPWTKTVWQLSAGLLMWDGGHLSVSSKLGMKEHAGHCECTTPPMHLQVLISSEKGHTPIKRRFHRPVLKAVTHADMWEIILALSPSKEASLPLSLSVRVCFLFFFLYFDIFSGHSLEADTAAFAEVGQ